MTDRRGDIYASKQHYGDPATSDPDIRDWGRYGTPIGREESTDGLITRTIVPCELDQPDGAQCAEMRDRPRDETGQLESDLTTERSTDADDDRVSIAAQTLDYARRDYAEPDGRGPINDALLPSQRPPPARGTEYLRFTLEETDSATQQNANQDESEDADWDSTEPDAYEGKARTELLVDARTRLPLRVTHAFAGDEVTLYWDYELNRLEGKEMPADFFRQPRPGDGSDGSQSAQQTDASNSEASSSTSSPQPAPAAGSGPEAEENIMYTGAGSVGLTTDSATGLSFRGSFLGQSAGIGARRFCLSSGIRYIRNEPPDPQADADPDGTTRDGSRLTQIHAEYNELQANGICVPGRGDLREASLHVLSFHRDSPVAAELREQVQRVAEQTQLEPSYGDFARGGIVTGPIGLQPTTAYLFPVDARLNSVVVDVGDTTVQIIGPFEKADVNEIVGRLNPF